jgi:hypothetical protein
MNRFRLMVVLLALALLCGCVEEKATTTTTTTEPTTTTTTTRATTTTTTRTTTTTTTTIPSPEVDRICAEYCQNNSYLSGTCRKSRFECEQRLEDKLETRTKLCEIRTLNTCCCKTNDSIEKNVTYNYGLI